MAMNPLRVVSLSGMLIVSAAGGASAQQSESESMRRAAQTDTASSQSPHWQADSRTIQHSQTWRKRDVIHITAQMEGIDVDVYTYLSRARPFWLRTRAAFHGMVSGVSVVIDGSRMDGVHELSRIQMRSVRQLRYLNGTDATVHLGTAFGAGAIMVTTRRGAALLIQRDANFSAGRHVERTPTERRPA